MTDKTSPDQFPVDSFKEAAPFLRRPFTPEAVKFKVQAGTLAVAYIDARLVVERLNMVCPHLWHDKYEAAAKGMVCHLTVDGITRTDYGDGYVGKGLFSDAFKRTAVKFGVGVSLYAIPATWLQDQHVKKGDDGKVKSITDAGMTLLRARYATWLKDTGQGIFGEPLDHGDTEESIGDVEAQVTPQDVVLEGQPTDEQRKTYRELLKAAGIDGADKEMLLTKFGIQDGVDATYEQVQNLIDHLRQEAAK